MNKLEYGEPQITCQIPRWRRHLEAGKSQTVDFSTLLTPAKEGAVVAGKNWRSLRRQEEVFIAKSHLKGNALDSSIPTKLRGKEKALPKPKKPSALRRAILQSRQSEGATLKAAHLHLLLRPGSTLPILVPSILANITSLLRRIFCSGISYVSPFPGNGNYCGSVVENVLDLEKIPDRAFYCQHLITTEVSTLAGDILDKLVFYQDRAYHQDPALYKRRFVCGFKDVANTSTLKRSGSSSSPPI
ncbi:hypothetical protein BV898_18680 [Hypsibius exemplaris]|uniref:Uncharacterized protein n=1 Tax=Hypsibius exemplaris TaxID=2072580 RepID=A0A9X6NK35_HYPEX|nr:hypothetical protein BV898_18680 [Hypsibius exemplaris]